jgi:hypothetical protein
MRESNRLMRAEITEPGAANLYLSLHGPDFENHSLLNFNDSVADQIGKRREEFRNAPGGLYELDTNWKVQSLRPESVCRVRAVMRSESGLRANERRARHFMVEKKCEHFAVQVVVPRCSVFVDVDDDFSRRPGFEHLFSVRGTTYRGATEETLNFSGSVVFRKESGRLQL